MYYVLYDLIIFIIKITALNFFKFYCYDFETLSSNLTHSRLKLLKLEKTTPSHNFGGKIEPC